MRSRVHALVLLLAGCVGVERAPSPDGGGAPGCPAVSPQALDFGEVDSRPSARPGVRAVTITNDGEHPRALAVTVGAPFEVTPPGAMLTPHTSASLSVTFSPRDGRRFVDELVFIAEDGGCQTRVPVQGLGSGSLGMPAFVDFGLVAPGARKTLDVTFTNSRRTEVTLSSLQVSPHVFELGSTSGVVPPGGTFVVPITAAPSVSGPVQGMLTGASDEGPVAIGLGVLGGVQAIEATPLVLRAPRVGLWADGQTPPFIERTVALRNVLPQGSPAVRFAGVMVDPQAGSAQELQTSTTLPLQGLAPGERGDFTLRLEPFSLGPHRYVLSLFFTPTQPQLQLTFDANVVRLPPCALVVTPAAPRLELTALADGGARGVVAFDNPGPDGCVVDDVVLDSATLRLTGGGEQLDVAPGAHHELLVQGPMPDAGVSAGTLRFHVLRRDEPVTSLGVFAP